MPRADQPRTIDGLTLFAPVKDKLSQLTVSVPDGLSDGINGPIGTLTLTLPADGEVLAHSANAQVFLIVQYHLGGPIRASAHAG